MTYLAALLAYVRLDRGVSETVSCEVPGLPEGSAAELAFERLISRVDAL